MITRAGRDAVGVEEDASPSDRFDLEKTRASAVAKTQKARGAGQPALIVDMLLKEQGVTIDALIKATDPEPTT